MMTTRLAGLMLVAIVAMGLSATTSASASGENPLFIPATGQAIVATSGTSIFFGDGHLVVCPKGVATGVVSNALLIGGAVSHLLECVSLSIPTSTLHCVVNSVGAAPGLILSNTLHGILGLILPSKRTGILFLPVASRVFVELEETACSPETRVAGNVAGEVGSVGSSSKTGKLVFSLIAGFGSVKDFDLTHGLGLVKPEITAFAEPAAISQTEESETEARLEVT